MRWPLARQILFPMVGILLLTVGLANALNAWVATQRVEQQIERQLTDVVRTLSSANFPLEENVLRQTRGLTGAEFAVTSLAGEAVASSDAALVASIQPDDAHFADLKKLLVTTAGGRPYLRRVVTLDRRPVGGTRQLLHVFYPRQAWRDAYVSAIWPPLATGGAAMLLVAVAAYAIARRVTQPIQQLQAQVQRIATGNFLPVVAPSRDDEVRDLALAVNQMAGKLTDYQEQTRRQERLSTLGTLGGGIAHQIRNAATGCRLALDLHQRDCPLGGDGNGTQPLAVATRQLELIESHIQRFLSLGARPAARRERVDLAEVARAAIALVEPMAQHLGAPIQLNLPAEPVILAMADRDSLEQMIVNLLVNAVQATAQVMAYVGGPVNGDGSEVGSPEPGVTLRLSQSGLNRGRITVIDRGPGPAAAIADRLFEPFATDKPGGTGLGLVVAQRIAEDHGGSIEWRRHEEQTWFIAELLLNSEGEG